MKVVLLDRQGLIMISKNIKYSAETRWLHQDYGLPGHFDKNFHKYQMKIGQKLDDTPSLGHLAGQEVPHQP